ncbi:hypothetical protein SAMN05877838_2080 [Hoeflea halophila]|uniref:Uncharacterized protein n=1 Tax=Hoeflea halophila TaxID=714899 RepID=A0A286IAZ9_9HYPH|nr:hypothetical protein [Hoeflea halophila]SOE17187.1 hypothetical protein SAMN05877838_2080 [Hoeflea halophila]
MTEKPASGPKETKDQSNRRSGAENMPPEDRLPAAEDPEAGKDAAGEDPNETEQNSLAGIGRKKMHRR